MLALATAPHGGHDPTQILFLFAVVAGVMFWRGLLKLAVTAIVVFVLILILTGAWSLLH